MKVDQEEVLHACLGEQPHGSWFTVQVALVAEVPVFAPTAEDAAAHVVNEACFPSLVRHITDWNVTTTYPGRGPFEPAEEVE
jgi:hypothetical protein